MALSTSVAVFTCLWIFIGASTDQQQITVKTGDDVTLQCLDPRGGEIKVLVWGRQDLEKDVFVWKHGKMFEDPQHPSFKNRVELRDPEMKDRDVSVTLKNVTIKDTGTYKCYVKNNTTNKPPQLITTIKLTVVNSGPEAGYTEDGDKHRHLKLVLIVFFVSVIPVVIVGIVCLIHRKCNSHFSS